MWFLLLSRRLQELRVLSSRFLSVGSARGCIAGGEESKAPDLSRHLRAAIRSTGPISVATYMKEVLTNPLSGYYMNRDVFGKKGDFITSPEISQMFGELVGVWCVNEWMFAGRPAEVRVVELGPGRGTLAHDMLRVFSQFEGMLPAVSLHLVEVSPMLSKLQAAKLCQESSVSESPEEAAYQQGTTESGNFVSWHTTFADVPDGFCIIVAHEFFDALPIHKFKKTPSGWREIMVDIDPAAQDKFRLVVMKNPTPASELLLKVGEEEQREEVELSVEGGMLVEALSRRLSHQGGSALLADYGHAGEKQDTFRAFKDHALHDPLVNPGSADLTADVDFRYLGNIAAQSVAVHGPVPQGAFLHDMGIGYRLQRLLLNASKQERQDLISGFDMITNPSKMGERFKMMALIGSSAGEGYLPAGFKPLE